MSQIENDPARLRLFAGELRSFAGEVEYALDDLKGYLGQLGESWRDQEFEEFVQEFASAQNVLRRFVDEARRTAPMLDADATALEDYQRTKIK